MVVEFLFKLFLLIFFHLKLAEKRRQFGSAASKKVREQFDIAQAARQLKTLFI